MSVYSLDIVRVIDVQEAKELSKPEWVEVGELVGPGQYLVQPLGMLDLKEQQKAWPLRNTVSPVKPAGKRGGCLGRC